MEGPAVDVDAGSCFLVLPWCLGTISATFTISCFPAKQSQKKMKAWKCQIHCIHAEDNFLINFDKWYLQWKKKTEKLFLYCQETSRLYLVQLLSALYFISHQIYIIPICDYLSLVFITFFWQILSLTKPSNFNKTFWYLEKLKAYIGCFINNVTD